MEDEASKTVETNESNESEEFDYKALYEQEKANSRRWERRAKANHSEIETAKKTADEEIAELKKRLDEKEKAEERSKVAAKIAAEKGVPADLIVGDDEESMTAWADKMISAFKSKPAPEVRKPGSFSKDEKDEKTEMRTFARQLLNND